MRGIFGKAWGLPRGARPHTVLGRLARDVRGNTLAIMAAALIPFCGLVGGGIDLSRMYITKTRLQHACDAGALGGRKQMGAGTWGTDDQNAARMFFDANFSDGSYGTTGLTSAFAEAAGKVTGSASATVPMTLMRVLGKTQETLSVTCDAEMRLPNTDIMFVLDTTGSMGDTPTGDSQTKLASLKDSVKCFYEIVARLDTNANCTTGTPSGGTGNQVQIRFGFVPYATNVNVGKLLKPEWFADSWKYQTREARNNGWTKGSDTVIGTRLFNPDAKSWTSYSPLCSPMPAQTAFVGTYAEGAPEEPYDPPYTSGPTKTTYWATYQYGSYYEFRQVNPGTWQCRVERRQVFGDLRRQYQRTDTLNQIWYYDQLSVNVGLLKNGTGWNTSFQWPVGSGYTNKTIDWDGCIEERRTVSQASYTPIPADAEDLDIDTVPTAGDASSLWGMVLPDLIYTRRDTGWTMSPVTTTDDYSNRSYYACPTESKLLQSWADPVSFQTYVDTLRAEGNTYHDIGLIWGGRLMSPDGLFAATNKFTPQGGEIDRHMIFMTDGDACTNVDNYTAYGVNWFDRRTTGSANVPTDGCTQTGTLTQQVNARMSAVCTAIKNKNITLWVISFGYVDPTTVTRLQNCATTNRYYSASNAATLQQTFQNIANQISQLRLTR